MADKITLVLNRLCETDPDRYKFENVADCETALKQLAEEKMIVETCKATDPPSEVFYDAVLELNCVSTRTCKDKDPYSKPYPDDLVDALREMNCITEKIDNAYMASKRAEAVTRYADAFCSAGSYKEITDYPQFIRPFLEWAVKDCGDGQIVCIVDRVKQAIDIYETLTENGWLSNPPDSEKIAGNLCSTSKYFSEIENCDDVLPPAINEAFDKCGSETEPLKCASYKIEVKRRELKGIVDYTRVENKNDDSNNLQLHPLDPKGFTEALCARPSFQWIKDCVNVMQPKVAKALKDCGGNETGTFDCVRDNINIAIKSLRTEFEADAKYEKDATTNQVRLASEYIGAFGHYDLWKVFDVGLVLPIRQGFFVAPHIGGVGTFDRVFQTEAVEVTDPEPGQQSSKTYDVEGVGFDVGIELGDRFEVARRMAILIMLDSTYAPIFGTQHCLSNNQQCIQSDEIDHLLFETANIEFLFFNRIGIYGGGGFLYNFTREDFAGLLNAGLSVILP